MGDVRHNIPVFNTEERPWVTTGGRNWRDVIARGFTGNDRELYDIFAKNASSGDWTLSGIQRALKLNPGDAAALYERAQQYAYENGLQIPLLPSTPKPVNGIDYYNYGYGGEQQLTPDLNIGTVGGTPWKYNSIPNYLGNTDVPPEELASGGRPAPRGGLDGIHADPVIKRYLKGGGGGQDDDIPAMLSSNEYIVDADVVAALGDGNPDAGAKKLDQMRANIRRHKRSASPNSIPPKAKNPEQYLKGK
jgi:hypothetical protein